MNHEFKVYLFSKLGSEPVDVAVYRSMTLALERWGELRSTDSLVSGLIFVGSTRPSLEEVERILSWSSFMLVAESARWLLGSSFTVCSEAVEAISGTANYPKMAVYLGFEGWGYEPTLASKKTAEVRPPAETSNPPASLSTRTTLFGYDEMSVSDDPFFVAKHLPEWALSVSIHDLPLTLRCRNVAIDQGFQTLSDLTLWSVETAKSWRNFGPQSMRHLADAIRRFVAFGPGQLAAREELPVSMKLPPLLSCMEGALLRLSPRKSRVLRARWGYNTAKETLESIASENSITRERIRQIELNAIRNIVSENLWVMSIAERIRVLLRKRTQPLFLRSLEIEDPWFTGFAEKPGLLGSLLGAFGAEDCHVIPVNRRNIVSHMSQEAWDSARSVIIETLKQRQSDRLDRSTVRVLIEAVLSNSPELSAEMLEEINDQLNFVQEQGNEVLVSVGKKVCFRQGCVTPSASDC